MATLNNSAAYGFSKNVIRPLIMKVLAATDSKKAVNVGKTTDKFKPIDIEVKVGRSKRILSVVMTYDDKVIALSMFNMMNERNIVFMFNQNIYIVDGKTLVANWSNVLTHIRSYYDGCAIRSQMTYADIPKLIMLASEQYVIPDEDWNAYQAELAKYKEGIKK